MKKILSIVLAIMVCIVILFNLSGCFGSKTGEIGQTYTSSDGVEFTLNAVEFTDVIDGWGGANDDFWKPLDETNCNIGGRYTLDEYKNKYGLVPKSEDDVIVFISYTAKNVSKNDKTIDDIGVLNYDDGYEYSDGELAYRVSEEGVWQELPGGIILKQLKENKYEFRAYMIVPKEVAESDKTLTYTLFGYEFELR